MSCIQTYTGKKFDLANPCKGDVCIHDIAHALSLICRFNGHVREFYSVAQHSVIVASMVPVRWKMDALLHDAHEAYTGDIVSPLKAECPEFKVHENRIASVVRSAFGISSQSPRCVKQADRSILNTEVKSLFLGESVLDCGLEVIEAIGPLESEDLFLTTFYELSGDQRRDLAGANYV